jgi:secreted trypsin-like serine protease
MKMLQQDVCQNRYGVKFNKQNNICGGESGANSGACQGDSGGPLVYQNPVDGLWYSLGLISYGYGCKFSIHFSQSILF